MENFQHFNSQLFALARKVCNLELNCARPLCLTFKRNWFLIALRFTRRLPDIRNIHANCIFCNQGILVGIQQLALQNTVLFATLGKKIHYNVWIPKQMSGSRTNQLSSLSPGGLFQEQALNSV